MVRNKMLLISKKLNNLSAHPGIEFRAHSIIFCTFETMKL